MFTVLFLLFKPADVYDNTGKVLGVYRKVTHTGQHH